jgi:hypothetical protein
MSEKTFIYHFAEAWITLFYQIIRLYQFSKINVKLMKQFSNCPEYIMAVPAYISETSNLFSA